MFGQVHISTLLHKNALLLRVVEHRQPQRIRHARVGQSAQARVDWAEFVRGLLMVGGQHTRNMRQRLLRHGGRQHPMGMAILLFQRACRDCRMTDHTLHPGEIRNINPVRVYFQNT